MAVGHGYFVFLQPMDEFIFRTALYKYDPCITYTVSLTLLQVIRSSAHVLHRLSAYDQIA